MAFPVPPSIIDTPRLRLVRLTDTTPGSQHVQWFHENWSDAVATGWSLHGATKSLEQSRLWMEEHMSKWDNWFYAVFVRAREPGFGANETKDENENRNEQGVQEPGIHVGSVSLRLPPVGLELPPPRSFDGAAEVGSGDVLSAEEVAERETALQGVELRLRVLGYAFFAHAHGKGYATEACGGLLEGYAGAVREWREREGLHSGTKVEGGLVRSQADAMAEAETVFYVEAGVDQENPGSQRVLRKLGFRTVGLKVEKEKAWLNGAWRGPGWWITGFYL